MMSRGIYRVVIIVALVVALSAGGLVLVYFPGTLNTGGAKSTTTTSSSISTGPAASTTPGSTIESSSPSSSSSSSSSSTATDKTSTLTIGSTIAKISFGSNPIPRGSTQSIWFEVADAGGPISNATASVKVLDASGQTSEDFTCTTNAAGDCWTQWTIKSDAAPGVFQATLTVKGVVFHSSFEVTTS